MLACTQPVDPYLQRQKDNSSKSVPFWWLWSYNHLGSYDQSDYGESIYRDAELHQKTIWVTARNPEKNASYTQAVLTVANVA